MERKKLFQVLIAVAFAVIFIISYSTVFDFGSPVSTITTTVKPQTAYAYGFSNAVITSYTPFINVSVKCNASKETDAVVSQINNATSNLEGNNSISTTLTSQNNISIEAGNSNSLQIYDYLYSQLNTTGIGCSTFSGGAFALLPPTVNFTVGSQSYPVMLQNATRQFITPIKFSQNLSLTFKVRVAAFLTQNAEVYGNVSVTNA